MNIFTVAEEKEYADCSCTAQTLANLSLGESSFLSVHFSDCSFAGTRCADSAFRGCSFAGCDMQAAHFEQTHFSNCRFSGCKLQGTYLHAAVFENCVCENDDFSYADLGEIQSKKHTGFSHCTFLDAGIEKAQLGKTVFADCDLSRVSFQGTLLREVELRTCTLSGIRVSENFKELRGMTIRGEQAYDLALLLGVKIEG